MCGIVERKFLRPFLKSLGTNYGVPGALSWPLVMAGFSKQGILIAYLWNGVFEHTNRFSGLFFSVASASVPMGLPTVLISVHSGRSAMK